MIPVNMNITNNGLIVIEKIFLANKMVPIAIQRDENISKSYKVLFQLTENISNSDIFFEFRLETENAVDKEYIENRSLFIDQMKKDDNKFKAFKEVMKGFNPDRFYVGGLKFNKGERNYYIEGFKQLIGAGKVFFEKIKIFVPRQMFIILSLYLEDLIDPYNGQEKEFLFLSHEINTARFQKVENVKLIASTKKQVDEDFSYNTMYEMNCGPTFWKFTYEIITPEDLELKEPLGDSIFDAEYSQYNERFIGCVPDGRGSNYILTTNENGKVEILVVSDELINKTNLIDPYKIFINEEEPVVEEAAEEKKSERINIIIPESLTKPADDTSKIILPK